MLGAALSPRTRTTGTTRSPRRSRAPSSTRATPWCRWRRQDLRGRGNFDQAEQRLPQGARGGPRQYVPAQLALVQLAGDARRARRRAGEAAEARRDAPQNPEAQLLRGRSCCARAISRGRRPARAAPQADPQNAEAHAMLGTPTSTRAPVGQRARRPTRTRSQLAPNNVDYRTTYGLLLGLNKQFEPAVAELKKVVARPATRTRPATSTSAGSTATWTRASPRSRSRPTSRRSSSTPRTRRPRWVWAGRTRYLESTTRHRVIPEGDQLEPKRRGEASTASPGLLLQEGHGQAKAAAEKAKAEGRNVDALLTDDRQVREGPGAGGRRQGAVREAAEAAGRGWRRGRSRRPGHARLVGLQDQAIREIVRFGAPSVEFLGYAAFNDNDLNVREAAINALGAVGGAARSLCPQLKHVALGPNPYESVISDKATMEKAIRWGDLQKAARAAVQKIGC